MNKRIRCKNCDKALTKSTTILDYQCNHLCIDCFMKLKDISQECYVESHKMDGYISNSKRQVTNL